MTESFTPPAGYKTVADDSNGWNPSTHPRMTNKPVELEVDPAMGETMRTIDQIMSATDWKLTVTHLNVDDAEMIALLHRKLDLLVEICERLDMRISHFQGEALYAPKGS